MAKTGRNLVLRADGGAGIGAGHIMRCLALAQAWQEEGDRAILASTPIPNLESRLRCEGVDVVAIKAEPGSEHDARETAALVNRFGGTWIVVDGYHFGTRYQRILKRSGNKLMFIDDTASADEYVADLVLNQNPGAAPEWYPGLESGARLLLGTDYALLRREFRRCADQSGSRTVPELARRILVTLGAADPHNVTLNIMEALRRLPCDNWEAVVVIAGDNRHAKEIRVATRDYFNRVRVESSVTDMSTLMAWADLAICAGGITSLELACMGLPALLLVIAENQRGNAESLGKSGTCVNLGWHENVSPTRLAEALKCLMASKERRAAMSRAGKHLVDGEGAKRVVLRLEG